jgi:YgiT-type zinc finger domain-containing protein
MKNQKCYECGGKIVKKKVPFKIYGTSLGNFVAEVCSKCGEKVFDEETSHEIERLAKNKGLWGMAKKVKIVKIGNSLAVRIPKHIAEFLQLKQGKETIMHPEKKKLVIET